jgi:hypothetical protein
MNSQEIRRFQKIAGLLESDHQTQQSKYEDFEKGLIKAWGDLLYLSYHELPNSISKIVDYDTTVEVFEDYYKNADEDEDFQDWMSDSPPTMNRGFAAFDKNRLSSMLTNIANKTKTKDILTIYRYEDTTHDDGWNSYTTNMDAFYRGPESKKSYNIPQGFPVIFADGLADDDEVIVNLSKKDKDIFLVK